MDTSQRFAAVLARTIDSNPVGEYAFAVLPMPLESCGRRVPALCLRSNPVEQSELFRSVGAPVAASAVFDQMSPLSDSFEVIHGIVERIAVAMMDNMPGWYGATVMHFPNFLMEMLHAAADMSRMWAIIVPVRLDATLGIPAKDNAPKFDCF